MKTSNEDLEKQTTDYKVNVQMITFIVIIMLVILTLVYFIKIYSNKKLNVIDEMRVEANLIGTVIEDHLNYSKYFISLIGKNIQEDPNNLEYIKETLQHHFYSPEFNTLFGWQKYSWINSEYNEVVTSLQGIEINPRKIDFISKIVDNTDLSQDKKDKIVFQISETILKADTLKLIDAIFSKKTKNFIGAVILSYDIDKMVKSLNDSKKTKGINFIIINKDLRVIAKSKPEIDKIIYEDNVFPAHLIKLLDSYDWNEEPSKEIYYLDMINGVNYFVKPLKNLPFAIIVNIDNYLLKNNIVETVTRKFLEVSFFALLCLIIIISIYKRETSLRTKAEKATLIANNATKAKTNFLAFTAHEIRSPLGFILTGSEFMKKELLGPLPKNYMKYVKGINSSAQVILDFITDMLDENQIVEGQFKIVNSVNNIEKIIKQIIKTNLGKKDITILTNFDQDLPNLVCDKRRISQVIDNLVNNSIKYSQEKTTITISVQIQDESMVIIITDEGIGMKEEEIPIALSKYGTLHQVDYQKGESYGLGLPIVKMLLNAHEATLNIQSVPGVGTKVKIIFPKHKIVYV